jgi:HSP20 family protein
MESLRSSFSPMVEVKETKEAFVFCADLPGLKEEDVEIAVTGNRISITGTRSEEERREDDRYYAYERSYGSFSRAFTLPNSADLENVNAELKNGVLRVTVPKKPEVQPRRIAIGGEKQGQMPQMGSPANETSKTKKERAA